MSADAMTAFVLPNHPTVDLTTPAGKVVAIDTEIAPLISHLWRLDFETLDCCQDARDVGAVIAFPDGDAWGFLSIAAEFGSTDIRFGICNAATSPHPGGWYLGAFVRTRQPKPNQVAMEGFGIMVGFPRAQLAAVIELFARVEREAPRSRNRRHRRV